MNEAETRAELIDPKLKEAGWGVVDNSKIFRERKITDGRIMVGGKRQKPLIADYVLSYKGIPVAVVEAKKDELDVSEGVAQAKLYAEKLQLLYTYATNGKEIYQINMKTGEEKLVDNFLSPQELWEAIYPKSDEVNAELVEAWREKFASIPFEDKSGTWQPRYYQEIAINRTMEAIANNQNRILLTLATGTGKTAIAFQIAWKLFHTRWNLSATKGNNYKKRLPRILFLADRNILADQAYNSFSAFPDDAKIRIKPDEIRKRGKVPTNGSIFFTIFQTFMSGGSTSSPTASSLSSPTALSSPNTSSSPIAPIEQNEIKFKEVETIKDAYAYMYILQCNDDSFYVGSTKNLTRRLKQHKSGEGAKYTKLHLPVKLVYYETFDRIDKAFNREKQIQKWSRAKKIALINNDIELLKQLSKSKNNEPKIAKFVESKAPELADTNVPELADINVPELADINVPELADINVPELSDINVPELADINVPELAEGYFGEYPQDFFDFIVIDECHRGGANDESNWRGILDYFSPAVQLGLTATPKRDINVDTYAYFGEPVYIYSLKEGINDGFLTPFKVKRIQTTLDEYVYTDEDKILEGEVEQGRVYEEKDFNRIIQIKEREEKRVKIFMNEINQNDKSIVFCRTQEHAAIVRDLINQYRFDKLNSRFVENRIEDNKITEPVEVNYCVRVTANDGKIGEQFLREFQDNEKTIPTILTTSQKLSTGVDARNVRNIILLRPVNSMIEFKQIVGRGTRIFEGKEFFTIYDFVNAYHHFNDPEWDGEPLEPVIYEPNEPGNQTINEPSEDDLIINEPLERPRKIKIKLKDGKEREIQHMIATLFYSAEGIPISSQEFLENLFGELPKFFKNEEELKKIWSNPVTRKTLLQKLGEAGFGKEELKNLKTLIDAEKSDLFDVLEYVFNSDFKPITREERANRAKATIFALLNEKQKEFIDFVLKKYIEAGVTELDQEKLPILLQTKYESLQDALNVLGDVKDISSLFIEFQKYLYDNSVA